MTKDMLENVPHQIVKGTLLHNALEGLITELEGKGVNLEEFKHIASIKDDDDDSLVQFDQMFTHFLSERRKCKSKLYNHSLKQAEKMKKEVNIRYGEKVVGVMNYEIIKRAGINNPRLIEVVRNLIVKDEEGECHIIKHRQSNEADINLADCEEMTPQECRAITDFESYHNKSILIKLQPYKFESKIFIAEEDRLQYFTKAHLSRFFDDRDVSLAESDRLAKVFDPIFDKQIIDEFPKEFSDIDIFSMERHAEPSVTLTIRHQYIRQAGFGIITKKLADKLAKFLKDKQCLEIMAGKGVLSKALQDRGIDIIATDNFSWESQNDDHWTTVENIEAGDAIRKYKNVDYILASWMPMNTSSKRLIRMIRKYNPDVRLIIIGEGYGGCTSNDDWFDRVEVVESGSFYEVYKESSSWCGIHDRIELYTVTKPWLKDAYDDVSI